VEFADVTANLESLRYLSALLAPRDSKQHGVRVEHVVLARAVIRTALSEVGPLDADIAMTADHGIARATVRGADGRLVADVVPDGDAYAITVEAREWTLPWGPRLAFDSLRMKGSATAGHVHFRQVAAEAYGGMVEGAVKLAWNDEVVVSGDLALTRLDLAALLGALSMKSRITGRLDAKPRFSIHVESADTLHLQGPFDVHAAVLHGVDVQAAASVVKQGNDKGETRFDQLSGQLAVNGKTYRYTNLKATSGALAVRGNVALSPSKALSGKVYAQLEALGAAAEVPLNVGGTLDAPVIAPTAASMAGAAVGTAVLGPVLGTSVGAKIGDVADNLLGSADERK